MGKVYVADNFYKVALPVNTSASGKGIDVPPTGTRLPITAPNIRTFVHWENAFDIDSSVVAYDEDGKVITTMNFCNYSGKYFGNDLLFSGDVTSDKGTEYFDLKLEGLYYLICSRKRYREIRVWRSLVSRLTGGQEAAGSSPVTRTSPVLRKEYGAFSFSCKVS